MLHRLGSNNDYCKRSLPQVHRLSDKALDVWLRLVESCEASAGVVCSLFPRGEQQ